MRNVTTFFVFLLTCSTAAASSGASKSFDFKVGGQPAVAVQSDAGSVTVEAGGAGAIHVEATARHGDGSALQAVEVKQEGDTVRVIYKSPRNHMGDQSVDFRITAPAGAKVEAHTGGGSMVLRGMAGGVDVDVGGGSVDAANLRGAMRLHTGGGSIRAERCDGTIDAETGGGSIHIEAALHGKNHIETGGGSVHLAIPAASKLAVDGSTGAGSIHNDFGLPVEGQVSRRLSGRIGDGSGGSLDIRTGAGSIELARQ